jgi:ERO1-like protein alpha
MDCVGCDKCRLWGKVQTHGMGTALKILFADLPRNGAKAASSIGVGGGQKQQTQPVDEVPMIAPFKLTRNDVVALFQSFGRYSASIWEVNEFRHELAKKSRTEL